jgi:GT2 family glycosyltransferase/glycosyltransferase involved in cell wall biosynthesis
MSKARRRRRPPPAGSAPSPAPHRHPGQDQSEHLRANIAELTARLGEIEASLGWRAVSRWRRLLERFAGPGSAQRRALDGVVGTLLRRRPPAAPAAQRLIAAHADADADVGAGTPAPAVEALIPLLKLKLRLFLEEPHARIAFPQHDDPAVTVILVLYNRAEYTCQCLESLRANADVPYEVVIVDNASSDLTGELLGRLDGVRVLRNAQNEGFLRACNRAAAAARGRWLLFLNNDTQPLPGFLSRLVAAGADPAVGAVGAKLVHPDGRLQEAGSIVWRDGSTAGYGRGGDPCAPEFGFAREVDYCSGACLLLRRELFERAGRFDERYVPAYYEETDACLAVRELGSTVRYAPDAVVIHYEFGSAAGKGESIALQVRNRGLFAAKWAARLQAHVASRPGEGALLAARDARRAAPRILVLDDRVPDPALGCGYPRSHALLQCLADLGWLVSFFPVLFPDRPEPVTAGLLGSGIEVLHGRDGRDFPAFLAARRGHYDVAWVSRPHNMKEAIGTIRAVDPGLKVVYDAEALFAARDVLKARLDGAPLEPAAEREAYAGEVALAAGADAIVAVSARELAHFRGGMRPGQPAAILAHPCRPDPTATGFEGRRDLLFVGGILSSPSPNEDAVLLLVREILPRVRRVLPLRLIVAGTVHVESVRALGGAEVVVTGRLASLRPWYEQCRVFVAPTRYAAGIPLKVLEAFSQGIPAVISPLLAEQLGVDESVALIGEGPEEFAEKALRLHHDAALWGRLRAGALEYVRRESSPEGFRLRLEALLRGVTGGRTRNA